MAPSSLRAQVLRPLYRQALRELPYLGTPTAVAARFENPDPDRAADRITAFYTPLSAATGFLFGLPGLLALPLTLPANLAGLAFLQLHMCAALATTAGLDTREPEVQDACIRCVLIDSNGARGHEELAGAAQRTAHKLGERGLRLLGEQILRRVARNAPRKLPFVGGVIGGTSDLMATARVARTARAAFLDPVRKPVR